jgi:copper homeostasis protein
MSEANTLLEICCFNLESALIAQDSGADRIELCENYALGGISPGLDLLDKLIPMVNIPIYCMVRPRGGNFEYSEEEFERMKEEILDRKPRGIQGFVLGMLDNDKRLEVKKLKVLMDLAYPLPITFHRAFDEILEPEKALEEIIDLGFERILSSGQKPSAWEGRDLLRELIEKSDQRISIMPGAGIRSSNISALKTYTGAREFHSSAILPGNPGTSPMEVRNLKKSLDYPI